jgi:hypothetical protein
MSGAQDSTGSSTIAELLAFCSSFICRLVAVYSPPPPAIPLGGGLVRKWIVMWWPQGKLT